MQVVVQHDSCRHPSFPGLTGLETGSASNNATNFDSLNRQAVRAIGRCAVNLDVAAERCINVLVELIKGRVSYVVQEAVVVVRDIFRKYPNKCAARAGPAAACLLKLPAGTAAKSTWWCIDELLQCALHFTSQIAVSCCLPSMPTGAVFAPTMHCPYYAPLLHDCVAGAGLASCAPA
jgi:Adaptin N terminal region